MFFLNFSKLPVICRQTGRKFGMFYNYFKILVFHLKPKERQSNELVSMLRNINQQSHAFTREFQSNLLSTKSDIQELMPGLKINPFENVGLKPDEPLKIDEKKKDEGVSILEYTILERRRIVQKKKEKHNRDNDFYN
jgi:hypothetical protein